MTEDDFAGRSRPEFGPIAVVGLGLMGGSLALALKEQGAAKAVVGIDTQPATLEMARARGAVDETGTDLRETRGAQLIVLATPVRTILKQLDELGEIAADGACILDLGSTKEQIVAAMDRLPARLQAVGGHPMCGKESSGFETADPALFRGKPFLLTPTARSTDGALNTAQGLAQVLGAKPIVMDARRHDQVVAAVSHLPFVVASNLVNTVEGRAQGDELYHETASSGWRDTTRLAASDVEMMVDILLTNGDNIADLMRQYSREFARLAELIYDEEADELRAILQAAAAARREWDAIPKRAGNV